MVFALTAAMLVGTPLTASAAPLNSVYSITDGTGTWNGHDSGSGTGTVTNTDTNTGALIGDNDAKIIGIVLDKQTVNLEKGDKEPLKATVILDDVIVNEKGEDITDDVIAEMSKKIKWEVLFLDADGEVDKTKGDPAAKVGLELALGSSSDRSKVQLNAKQGTEKGEEVTVRATIDSRYYYVKATDGNQNTEVKLNTSKRPAPYTAEATVSVKEYSESLSWSDNKTESNMYLNHTLDLGEVIRRNPETANDTITWTSTNTKVATVSATGVVTAKKVNWEGEKYTQTKGKDDECKIIAVGERKGAKVERTIKVEKGTAATGVAVFTEEEDEEGNTIFKPLKTYTQDLKDNRENQKVLIQTYAKADVALDANGNVLAGSQDNADINKAVRIKKNVQLLGGDWYVTKDADGNYIQKQLFVTDVVTLSSNKNAVASAELTKWNNWGSGEAEVTHESVGQATITVKTTSNKKATFKVNVKATLKNLAIEGIEDGDILYSGQSVTLTADKTPAESKDAVKWSIAKVQYTSGTKTKEKANPNAKINAKGVLTISNKIDPEYPTVTIHLESSKNYDGKKIPAEKDVTINVKQSSIDGISILKTGEQKPIAVTGLNSKKQIKQTVKGTSNISVPLYDEYVATVTSGYANTENYDAAEGLTWKSSKPKVAQIVGTGKNVKIKALSAGSSTITVSGVRAVQDGTKDRVKSASVIKLTFTVKVKQPVKSITLNKPSVVLAEQTQTKKGVTSIKSQKVALKATLGPKGVNKKEAIIWSVLKNGEAPDDGTKVPTTGKGSNVKNVTTANATFNLVKPEVGDVYTITAKTASGASATSTVMIVKKTQAVQIAKSNTLDDNDKPVIFVEGEGKKAKNNTTSIEIGDDFQMFSFVNVGKDGKADNACWKLANTSDEDYVAEDVTYSVNKKGIVSIDKYGNVLGLKKGTVTITAKAPMGKKATLKVTVK